METEEKVCANWKERVGKFSLADFDQKSSVKRTMTYLQVHMFSLFRIHGMANILNRYPQNLILCSLNVEAWLTCPSGYYAVENQLLSKSSLHSFSAFESTMASEQQNKEI